MKGDPAVVAKSSKEFLHQFEIKGPNPRPPQLHMKDQTGPHREVQGHGDQCLIHRGDGHSVSLNSL